MKLIEDFKKYKSEDLPENVKEMVKSKLNLKYLDSCEINSQYVIRFNIKNEPKIIGGVKVLSSYSIDLSNEKITQVI